ncbi:hypothetical protein OHC51_03570 [Stenotrophomonas indicatrix]|uniref:hypothetical protein n=1 Tax=Stenotrophomonas indicatrix TaxID=2045451 RepID=UPI00300AF5A4
MNVWIMSLFLSGGLCAAQAGAAAPSGQPFVPAEDVVQRLNQRYMLVDNSCREQGTNFARGHYYCSGLIMRGTDDGYFLPWEHSPNSIARGSVSFFWIRQDLAVPVFDGAEVPTRSGFVLWAPQDEIDLGREPILDQGVICIFPFDAVTYSVWKNRGCGYKRGPTLTYPQPEALHRNMWYAWGQCEGMGIKTADQWMALWNNDLGDPQLPDQRAQCSWNADSQSGWDNMISIRKRLSGPNMYGWNEVMVDTRDDSGAMLMPHIAAFWYVQVSWEDPMQSLSAARIYQAKLLSQGYYAPILRLDFSAPSSQRFSYRAEDQGSIPLGN